MGLLARVRRRGGRRVGPRGQRRGSLPIHREGACCLPSGAWPMRRASQSRRCGVRSIGPSIRTEARSPGRTGHPYKELMAVCARGDGVAQKITNRCGQLAWIVHDAVRTRDGQLVYVAYAPGDADGGEAAGVGAENVE